MRTTRSIIVRRPIDEVFRYLADPSRLGAWDRSALEPHATSGCAIGIGSQFAYEIERSGKRQRVTAEVIAYEPPARIGWLSCSDGRREITRITLERSGNSTVIHLRRLRVDSGPDSDVTLDELERLLAALREALERGRDPPSPDGQGQV